ncbi:hypothetical protein SAMN02745121_02039 [Nannocystis exedens]|uniref:PQQ-like domain-containing protein n=1 Tax=Nannocystis exedens TaxID=54 RepID=A0A1I1VWG4_9BACT|nr:hypothetical protein [Nannocystis exedens]PCC72921.1 hypothetical protein NAEX_06007 [Nannocystis exedens]SFD87446.1 hypothetical protein SAMN02745121_02039 [Nannocystis exedens]
MLDDDGKIFVAGSEEVAAEVRTSIVRAFDTESGELWRFAEEPRPGHADTSDLALADGALYSVGTDGLEDGGGLFTVRRHDPVTGGLAWRTATQAGWKGAYGTGITATAERVVGVGYVRDEDSQQALMVVLDADGAILSETIQQIPRGFWSDIVPIGAAGDLMLVGGTFMPGVINRDVIVRRVDANFVEQWSHIHDHEMRSLSMTMRQGVGQVE